MLDALVNSVLPIFSLAVIGIAFARLGWFDEGAAEVLNRFVYYVSAPVLLFQLIATVDFSQFDWRQVGGYLGTELAVYVTLICLFHYGFKRPFRQSILLAMTGVFSNHILYLLPIATVEFGEEAARRMVTFVVVDLIVFYGGSLILLDATAPGGEGSPLKRTLVQLSRNTQVMGMIAGAVAKIAGLPLNNGIGVFAQFVGTTAAPISLFALGIILANQRQQGSMAVSGIIAFTKLVVMPGLVALVFFGLFAIPRGDASLGMLVAAAPSGVLPFVLALRNGIPTLEISRAVLFSFVGSVVTVAFVLQFT